MRSITLEIGRAARLPLAALFCVLLTGPLTAQVAPPRSPLAAKRSSIGISRSTTARSRSTVLPRAGRRRGAAGSRGARSRGRECLLDPRGARFATLLLSHPLIPEAAAGTR